ncbi:septum site-determining protein MinD [Tengunoibacter tsumagoiensis]|uniref:Septum site-determining protein MinD n=1 Tax=Tengunoibacter tsumagoiensis TaxID=2014871 RepID=A0A401ZTN2_9CHLR|nr:septum site-determining protein MinD [Tengunoibacter tsumagoiensis]GCE10156.1 site-determining protein [Tengunoibacter tsumagoiensis]
MDSRVITITSGKGGVGKTTTTANLGSALAAQGKKVVVVDADIGLRNLDATLGLENRIVYDLVDVVEGQCRLRQALIKDKRLPEFYLLPAAQTRDKNAINSTQMVQLCQQMRQEFDLILIDSPAGIEQGFRNAIVGADEILIVANPEMASVRDADRIIGLVESAGKPEPRLILNRLRPEMVKRGDMMDVADVLEVLGIDLMGIIPEDELIIVATNKGEPAIYDKRSRAGRAFVNTAQRLLGEEVPLDELAEAPSLIERLRRFVGFGPALTEERSQPS